jgi:hypothetical protein
MAPTEEESVMPTLTDEEYEQFRRLVDLQAIRDCNMRNSRAMDRMDGELLDTVYWPDGWDSASIFDGPFSEYRVWVMEKLATFEATQHNIGNVHIDLQGDDAYSESYFVAYHRRREEDGDLHDHIAGGRYLDHMVKRDGEWRIFHRRRIYDWNLNQPATSQWERPPASDIMERGCRGRGDGVYRMDELLR